MWAVILVALATGASAQQPKVASINVESGGKTLVLLATGEDTIYKLKTQDHARIISVCTISQDVKCENTVFKYTVDDKEWINSCNESQRTQFVSSHGNEYQIRIGSTVNVQPISCKVAATKPFVGLHDNDHDSSEHGIEGLTNENPTCRCGWSNKKNQRIVGGKRAEENEFPFIARILINAFPICGGSIITQYHILTAAHCTHPYQNGKNKFQVSVGDHESYISPKRQVIEVAKIFDHKHFNPILTFNDISIVILKQKITFDEFIGPVCMPSGGASSRRNLVNDFVKVIGWGATKFGGDLSPVLKKLNLAVLDNEICATVYRGLPGFQSGHVLCAYRDTEGSCQGDSGGPLVYRSTNTNMFVQAALVSYGRICASRDPFVNTDVRHYLPWIQSVILMNSPEKGKSVDLCYSK